MNEQSNAEYAAEATKPLKKREELVRELNGLKQGEEDSNRLVTNADAQALAENMSARARTVIENIETDRTSRIEHAKSQGKIDQTEYDPELAHLQAIVTDEEEAAISKERRKRKPDQEKIHDLQDAALHLQMAAIKNYDSNPLAKPGDVFTQPHKGALRRFLDRFR